MMTKQLETSFLADIEQKMYKIAYFYHKSHEND